jgi:endonuclease/exonuclease/phosphatase family metal-dependent hydrolase
MDNQSATTKFEFATFNIDQARREEDFEETKFDVRWPRLKKMIQDANVDVLCLQELRNLETSKISVSDLLYQVSQLGYDYKHAYYGPDRSSFAQVIFYKRDKFFITGMDIQLLPLDEKKPNASRVVLSLKLRAITTGKEFYVCSTHFGFEEHEKDASCRVLKDYLDSFTQKDIPYLCAGDFNFFDDKDGGKHRAIMLESSKDLAYPLSNASGTFMGFKKDANKQPYEKMSRLDHIFVNDKVISTNQARVFGDLELVQKREYPSDHLMIVVNVSIKQ